MYELQNGDYDATKLISPTELWEVVEAVQRNPYVLNQSDTFDPRISVLSDVLREYTHTHENLINVHTGIFRPRVVVTPEIQRFMLDSLLTSKPS